MLIFASFSLSGYLGYRLHTLSQAYAALEDELDRTSHRADLLQRKYAEQKAQSASLQRAKLTVEGLKRQAEMKVEALAEQLEAKNAEIADVEKKINGRITGLEAKIAERNDVINQWKVAHAKLTDTFKEAKRTIAQRDETIANMEAQAGELESQLDFTRRTRDRYLSENHKMADISKSILARYDEKGIFATALIHVEPFTQIQKVELEKLIQDYLDGIDDHVIRDGE